MNFSLLELSFLFSGAILLILSYDIARRQRFNALHFFVFLVVALSLFLFVFYPPLLAFVGRVFGVERGADVLVYFSIIFLFYISVLLIRKVEDNRSQLTGLVRSLSIKNAHIHLRHENRQK